MKLDLGNYQCAIFDLDGTLLDSTWVWEKIDIDFLAKRGIAVPADYMQEIRNHNFITGSKYVIERFHLNENAEDIAAEWHEMAQEQYDNVITLKPGAGAFLRKLKAQGMKLTVATSSTHTLFEKCLKRNGIYDLFDSFTETHEVERGKGYPDVYELAALRCQTDTAHCIVFEDILKAVQGAKKADFIRLPCMMRHPRRSRKKLKNCVTDIFMNMKNWSRNAEEVFII